MYVSCRMPGGALFTRESPEMLNPCRVGGGLCWRTARLVQKWLWRSWNVFACKIGHKAWRLSKWGQPCAGGMQVGFDFEVSSSRASAPGSARLLCRLAGDFSCNASRAATDERTQGLRSCQLSIHQPAGQVWASAKAVELEQPPLPHAGHIPHRLSSFHSRRTSPCKQHSLHTSPAGSIRLLDAVRCCLLPTG